MIEIDEYRQLLLENGCRPANCFFRIDRAIELSPSYSSRDCPWSN
jgi:hypothetical protein